MPILFIDTMTDLEILWLILNIHIDIVGFIDIMIEIAILWLISDAAIDIVDFIDIVIGFEIVWLCWICIFIKLISEKSWFIFKYGCYWILILNNPNDIVHFRNIMVDIEIWWLIFNIDIDIVDFTDIMIDIEIFKLI